MKYLTNWIVVEDIEINSKYNLVIKFVRAVDFGRKFRDMKQKVIENRNASQ